MKVCFLLGSGASVPAGFPKVAEITEKVLSKTQHVGHMAGFDNNFSDGGRNLLRWLEIQIKRRYVAEGAQAVHYESLYFLAKQIKDDLLDDYDNPAIRPFIEDADEQVLPMSRGLPGNASDELQKMAEDVVKYIRRVVASSLSSHQPTRVDHLDFIVDAIQQNVGSPPGILTLNHDTLLEKNLTEKNIEYFDGFAKEPNEMGVREWLSGKLAGKTDALRVLKLHGGVDWFRFRPEDSKPWLEDYVGIQTPSYTQDRLDSLRRRHVRLADSLPIFLIGSWDKLTRYTDQIYLEIYYSAFEEMRTAEMLVIVGYGFGDKGINKLITDWMYSREKTPKKMLIIDARPLEELRQMSRGSIAGKLPMWKDEGRLTFWNIPLGSIEVSWERITQVFGHCI